MSKVKSPGLIQEIGAIAGLYRTVFWMMGQRLHRGPNWEEDLTEEALRIQAPERHRDPQHTRSSQRN